MLITGFDYHPGFQQIAFVDTETGEASERRLAHREEAEQFYTKLSEQGRVLQTAFRKYSDVAQLSRRRRLHKCALFVRLFSVNEWIGLLRRQLFRRDHQLPGSH